MANRTPESLFPTDEQRQSLSKAGDWAAVEIAGRVGRRFIGTAEQFRAVRALREGRQAYLCFESGPAYEWAKIANDFGREQADQWLVNGADPEIEAHFGRVYPPASFAFIAEIHGLVSVIDPLPLAVAAE